MLSWVGKGRRVIDEGSRCGWWLRLIGRALACRMQRAGLVESMVAEASKSILDRRLERATIVIT